MKKLVSVVLTCALMINLMCVSVGAATDQALVDAFAENLVAMTALDEFYFGIDTVLDMEDVAGIKTAYTNGFAVLSTSDQGRMASFKTMVDIGLLFAEDLKADGQEITKLQDDSVDAATLSAAIMSDYPSVKAMVTSKTEAELAQGISQSAKIFEILDTLELMSSFLNFPFFDVTAAYGDMTVNHEQAQNMLIAVNTQLGEDLTDFNDLIESLAFFTAFYNGASTRDRSLLYDYFDHYGFIKIVGQVATASDDGEDLGDDVESIDDEFVPEAGFGFTDIGQFTWASSAILMLNQYGIARGKGSGQFDPAGMVTRSEFATMLVRMLELTSVRENPFSDVSPEDWYAAEVTAAYDSGIIQGDGAGLFMPTNYISRQEIGTMIARTLIINGYENLNGEAVSTVLGGFPDSNLLADWAVDPVALVVSQGIITGVETEDDIFLKPTTYTSRAEVAVMLFRLSELISTVMD